MSQGVQELLGGGVVWTGVVRAGVVHAGDSAEPATPLGLPPIPYPEANPQTPEKIALGDKLFNDQRFSATGEVSCATCHAPEKAFTDGPLRVSEGIESKTGTRNAPTVINSVYFKAQFWDGRSPDLEDQARHPFTNPVEMGLADHEPIVAICRTDREYKKAFKKVFGVKPEQITIEHVTMAIAAFERTQVFGNSPFDHYHFLGQADALTAPYMHDGSVIYGHVHQIQYNQIGNISFHAVMATAWPWPYPGSYVQAANTMPQLTVPMNRADPFHERDATGWQTSDLRNGRVAMNYNLNNNEDRSVAYDPETGQPQDITFQDPAGRIPPQTRY